MLAALASITAKDAASGNAISILREAGASFLNQAESVIETQVSLNTIVQRGSQPQARGNGTSSSDMQPADSQYSSSRPSKVRKRLSIDTHFTDRRAQDSAERFSNVSQNFRSAGADSSVRPPPELTSPYYEQPQRDNMYGRPYSAVEPRPANSFLNGTPRRELSPTPVSAHPYPASASQHLQVPASSSLVPSARATVVAPSGPPGPSGPSSLSVPSAPSTAQPTPIATAVPRTPGPEASPTLPHIPHRTAFMSAFEAMYDQMELYSKMEASIKEQVRKSTALLHALEASGQMIEGLVYSHFCEMQMQYGEKFGVALTDLNRRIRAIEARLGLAAPLPPSQPRPTSNEPDRPSYQDVETSRPYSREERMHSNTFERNGRSQYQYDDSQQYHQNHESDTNQYYRDERRRESEQSNTHQHVHESSTPRLQSTSVAADPSNSGLAAKSDSKSDKETLASDSGPSGLVHAATSLSRRLDIVEAKLPETAMEV
eukprot:jgi/Hompol1/2009/HPOL_005817-RA